MTETYDVVIVGAGPAGLTVAEKLAIAGQDVTIYELWPTPGGLLLRPPTQPRPRAKDSCCAPGCTRAARWKTHVGLAGRTGLQVEWSRSCDVASERRA